MSIFLSNGCVLLVLFEVLISIMSYTQEIARQRRTGRKQSWQCRCKTLFCTSLVSISDNNFMAIQTLVPSRAVSNPNPKELRFRFLAHFLELELEFELLPNKSEMESKRNCFPVHNSSFCRRDSQFLILRNQHSSTQNRVKYV